MSRVSKLLKLFLLSILVGGACNLVHSEEKPTYQFLFNGEERQKVDSQTGISESEKPNLYDIWQLGINRVDQTIGYGEYEHSELRFFAKKKSDWLEKSFWSFGGFLGGVTSDSSPLLGNHYGIGLGWDYKSHGYEQNKHLGFSFGFESSFYRSSLLASYYSEDPFILSGTDHLGLSALLKVGLSVNLGIGWLNMDYGHGANALLFLDNLSEVNADVDSNFDFNEQQSITVSFERSF